MALRWVDPLVDGLPELRCMYSRMMIMMNGRLDQTLLHIAHFLAQKGFLAMPVHASDVKYSQMFLHMSRFLSHIG